MFSLIDAHCTIHHTQKYRHLKRKRKEKKKQFKKFLPKLSLSVEYSNDFDADLWLAIAACGVLDWSFAPWKREICLFSFGIWCIWCMFCVILIKHCTNDSSVCVCVCVYLYELMTTLQRLISDWHRTNWQLVFDTFYDNWHHNLIDFDSKEEIEDSFNKLICIH